MKVTERPVEPKKEKVLEITESEFIDIMVESGKEVLDTLKKSTDDLPEIRLLTTILCADLSSTVTAKLFYSEEDNK